LVSELAVDEGGENVLLDNDLVQLG
jgi:hypothetical protein